MRRRSAIIGSAALLARPGLARAQPKTIRLSHGYGVLYLALMVMRDRKLIEAHVAKAGLDPVQTEWRTIDGGNTINDAMLSGALDVAGIGVPGFVTLWAKAHGGASAVTGVCALGNGALWLNTNRPEIKTLADIGPQDRIAVPGIKTSFAAVVLEIAAAQTFGIANYAKLDPQTVGLPHPDALVALTSRRSEITCHFASPPFSQQELTYPGIHRVLSTTDLLGAVSINVVFAPTRFADANPAFMQAFLAAMDEANAFIAADKDAAAESYLRVSGMKMPKTLVRQLLDDPETTFTTAPVGATKYSDFLSAAGLIKLHPASWKEMFIPQMQDRVGS